MKTNIQISFYILFIFFFYSCENEKKNEDYSIELIKVETYAKEFSDEGGVTTPSIILKFKFKNNTNDYKFFSTKQNLSDKRNLSRFYLIDTLKNQVILIYSGDKIIIKPNEIAEINGIIQIRDFKNYFNLDDNFLNKTNEMLDNSIILYAQDSLDIKPFLAINNAKLPIKLIGNNILIRVKKESIKAQVFIPNKLKQLKQIDSK
jgi:hypothetical protein